MGRVVDVEVEDGDIDLRNPIIEIMSFLREHWYLEKDRGEIFHLLLDRIIALSKENPCYEVLYTNYDDLVKDHLSEWVVVDTNRVVYVGSREEAKHLEKDGNMAAEIY